MSLTYLLIAGLLLIGLLIVLFAFAAGAAEWWLRIEKSRLPARSHAAPIAPWSRFSAGERLHLSIGLVLFAALMISGPLAWVLFGNAAMPIVRLSTAGILLLALYAAAVGSVVIARKPVTTAASVPGGQGQEHDPSTPADLVARITQRFCPQCRAPLSADAPEGLCPACLMAGGVTTPPSSVPQPPAAGEWGDLAQYFPQLEILELLGRGGMGAVYKARQKNLDRMVALKVIPPEAAKDPAFAERFAREARALARLNHANIVTVYDFGQAGDVFYLLMEFVDGVNLRQAQSASRLAPSEALAIVPHICDALQFAHDQGVVHRDIKPENILLDRAGRVKIADFGLAKMLGKGPDDFTLTGTQQVMGTPRYMAPEQIEKPASVDHRADIYSLGVVIYEMLTGELPIGRFQPPSHKVEIDVRIDEVVLRALEKEPERRFQRASHVKSELESASHRLPTAKRFKRPTPVPPLLASGFATPPVMGIVLMVACGIVMGLLMMTAGIGAFIYAIIAHPSFDGMFWGWMGPSFGCLAGGFGAAAGSYNTYRQLAGAEDIMWSPRTTWFDWFIYGYLGFGLLLLAAAIATYWSNRQISIAVLALLILGGVATFQGLLFWLWRLLARAAAREGRTS